MNLINLIVWLSAGVIIGWFASRMVQAERRLVYRPVPVERASKKR